MHDGALMGTRFDAAFDPDTDHRVTDGPGIPILSSNDPDTPGNGFKTQFIATGDDESGAGMFCQARPPRTSAGDSHRPDRGHCSAWHDVTDDQRPGVRSR